MKNNNVLLIILILLVLILIIGGFFYIKNISDKQNEILANISEGNIVNKNTTNNAEENNMNLVAETDKNIDDETEVQVTFNPDKMISTNKFVRYEEDLRDRGTSGINVEVKDGKVFDERIKLEGKHSEYFIPLLQDLMQKNKITFSELSGIIVVNGPGSFTGVRLGVVVAKLISITINIIPVIFLHIFFICSFHSSSFRSSSFKNFSNFCLSTFRFSNIA